MIPQDMWALGTTTNATVAVHRPVAKNICWFTSVHQTLYFQGCAQMTCQLMLQM
jgi:hypothetical protein